MRDDLLEFVLARADLADLDPAARRLALRDLLPTPELAAEAADAIDGYGPLSRLMEDDGVTDVLVNGPHDVWVERAGALSRTTVQFSGARELLRYAERWLAASAARADASTPIGDGRLRDGSRVHVVLPPAAPDGPIVSIRKFPRRAFDLDSLHDAGMMTKGQHAALDRLVENRRSVLVTGGTGSGKTTLLAALVARIPRTERVVVVEEVAELRPRAGHHVSLLARPPNVEGKGAVDLATLLRASLRMRPDRIVVGEVRGPEALVALDAMSTGHDGSMMTLHARSAAEADERLVALALAAASGTSEASLRARARRSR
jgi:pilus assembly protein CpaF